MEVHDFFLSLLIILLTARIFAELATRLQAPSVIGELFAGVVLGPSLLGWIEPTQAIRLMAGASSCCCSKWGWRQMSNAWYAPVWHLWCCAGTLSGRLLWRNQ